MTALYIYVNACKLQNERSLILAHSISISWFNSYSELSNTREALNTQLPNFSTTIKEKGKDKTYKTNDKLQEFKINSLKWFIANFHHFTFQFEIFMQKKNKEIYVLFD
jgi:hypothetical protein